MGFLDHVLGSSDIPDELEGLLEELQKADDPNFEMLEIHRSFHPKGRRISKLCDKLEELATRGHIDVSQVPRLLEFARHSSLHVAGTISQAVAKLGAPAIPHVYEFLYHDDWNTRSDAGTTLGLMGTTAIPYLESAFKSSSRNAQQAALSGLVTNDEDDEAFFVLRNVLFDPDLEAQRLAARGLGFRSNRGREKNDLRLHEQSSDALASALYNPDIRISSAGAYGLAYMGGEHLESVIMALPVKGVFREIDVDAPEHQYTLKHLTPHIVELTASDRAARIRAANRLEISESPLGIPFLMKSIRDDSDPQARACKAAALWRLAHLPER